MSTTDTQTIRTDAAEAGQAEPNTGFFVYRGTHNGDFTTPDGDRYDLRLEPREVTDPRTGEASIIWGGYVAARDRDLAARDAMLQAEFKKSGRRPAELFAAEAKDIPLYLTLRPRAGKGYTDIGSLWTSKGRYTVLARNLEGSSKFRFGGNVLAWKSAEVLDNERAAKAAAPPAAPMPDAAAAREGADVRARKARALKAPAANKG